MKKIEVYIAEDNELICTIFEDGRIIPVDNYGNPNIIHRIVSSIVKGKPFNMIPEICSMYTYYIFSNIMEE